MPTGVTMNPDGTLTVAPNTPAGTYDITYTICDKVNTSNCQTVTSQITIDVPTVVATDDTETIAAGENSTTSVLANDTYNGQPATIGASGNVNLTQVITTNTGVTLNTTTGMIEVAPGTAAGTHTVTYSICDKVNPTTNCQQATATVTVPAPTVVANNDTETIAAGTTGTTSVLANDTYYGATATATNVNLTQVSTTNPGLTLNTTTGMIEVAPGTLPGSYTVTYTICDIVNAGNCQQATATVTVTNNPLPVVITNFSGNITANTVTLIWTSGVETNFSRYEVEKKAASSTFEKVGNVSAKGSNSAYTFTAVQVESAATYRLKLTDNDGSINYSNEITINNTSANTSILIYLNPVRTQLNVKVAKDAVLNIYNSNGALVKTTAIKAGINHINVHGLAAGVYFVKTSNGETSRFIKN